MGLELTLLYFPRTKFIHLHCSYEKRKATACCCLRYQIWNGINQNRILNDIMQLISYKDAWQSQVLRATENVQYITFALISNCCCNLVISVKTWQYKWSGIQLYTLLYYSEFSWLQSYLRVNMGKCCGDCFWQNI